MVTKTTSWCIALLALCAPFSVSADVTINEFLYDAPGTDTDQEYVELFNSGSAPVDLTKWKINDGSNHTLNVPPKNGGAGSITIVPGGYVLLVDNAANFIAAHPGVAGTVIDTVLSLSNISGTISLIDDAGATASTVSYSKDQGGNGDGNSLQRNGVGWIMAAPTMNATNATVAATPVVDDPSSASTTQSAAATPTTPPSSSTPVSSYVAPPEPTLFADAGDDRTVIVGADTEFMGRAYDRKKQDVDLVRFVWNFGDGSTAEGPTVLHHYDYPGRYAVVLSIARDRTAVADRVVVVAEPAKLSFTANPDGSVTIGNEAGRDLDLSGWIVRSFVRYFILPEHSVILQGSSLRISQKTLDLFSGPETELDYPNGALALKANDSTPEAPIAAATPASGPHEVAVSNTETSPQAASVVADSAAAGAPVEPQIDGPKTKIAQTGADDPLATSSSGQTASAAGAVGGHWYWWLAVVGLVALLAAAAVVVRGMKKGEWDIVEESPEAE